MSMNLMPEKFSCEPEYLLAGTDICVTTDDVPENVVQVNDGTARLDTIGLLLDKLVVKADDVTLESGTDYTAAFNDDGTVTLAVLPDGKGAGKTQLTVSGKRIAPEKVKGKDVIGGVSVDGKETGMEVLRQVFPKLGVVPGSLVAPWFSKDPTCAAIMQAKSFANLCGVAVSSHQLRSAMSP